jgi:hypothetical protein
MDALRLMLRQAARSDDWQRAVVHRCAWCKRVAAPDGTYDDRPRLVPATSVVTDGICPTCGAEALAQIRRRAVAQPLAA